MFNLKIIQQLLVLAFFTTLAIFIFLDGHSIPLYSQKLTSILTLPELLEHMLLEIKHPEALIPPTYANQPRGDSQLEMLFKFVQTWSVSKFYSEDTGNGLTQCFQ